LAQKPDRFSLFLLKAALLGHDGCGKQENAEDAFQFLLGLPADVFRTKIVDRLTNVPIVLCEPLKTMGVRISPQDNESRQLTAVGAWLLALGAFRKVEPGRDDWDQVFDVTHLNDQELQNYALLPKLPLETARKALRKFFTLCEQLFENAHPETARERPPSRGPLLQVTARRGTESKEGGLFFLLDFPYSQRLPGREQSLMERIEEYFRAVDQGEQPKDNGTSGALGQFRRAQTPEAPPADQLSLVENLCLVKVRAVTLPSGVEGTEVYFA
jgi:hypothetical protein